MTQFATLVLKNYQDEDKNFTVGTVDIRTGVATWFNPNPLTTAMVARNSVTHSLSLPSAKSSKARTKLKVSIPILDADNNRIDEDIFTCEFAVSKAGFLADRQNLIGFARSFLLSDTVEKSVLGSEGVY